MRGLTGLVVLSFAFFSSMIGMASIIARFTRELGLSASGVGFIFSIAPLVAASLRLPIGILADRYGVRVFLVAGGFAAAGAGFTAALMASVEGIIVARIMQGIALALFITPSIVASFQLPDAKPSTAVAYRSASVSLAATVSPVVAGLLVDHLGYATAFGYAGFAGLTATFIALMLPLRENTTRARRSLKGSHVIVVREARKVTPFFAMALMDGMVFFTYQSLIQSHLRDMGYPATVYGIAGLVNGIAGAIARASTARLMHVMGAGRLLMTGFIIEALATGLLTRLYTPPGLYLVAALYGVGLGLIVPSEQVLLVDNVDPRVRNTVVSFYSISFDLGGFIGPNVYGFIAEVGDYTRSYTLMPLPSITAAIIVLFYCGRTGACKRKY